MSAQYDDFIIKLKKRVDSMVLRCTENRYVTFPVSFDPTCLFTVDHRVESNRLSSVSKFIQLI